jgi:hypothetical protein
MRIYRGGNEGSLDARQSEKKQPERTSAASTLLAKTENLVFSAATRTMIRKWQGFPLFNSQDPGEILYIRWVQQNGADCNANYFIHWQDQGRPQPDVPARRYSVRRFYSRKS